MLLQVKGLNFAYQTGRQIFSQVNFSLDKGEILSILGPNGAGKSTLLNCLANLLKPSQGDVFLGGRAVKSMAAFEIAQKLGYVPQIYTPTYAYTVREFTVMGRAPYMGMFTRPKAEDYKLADEALEMLNIAHLADKPCTEISGGERQQATIARVIVQQPDIIMLDEPTSHLDFGNQIKTLKIIKELAKQGFGIIMTTHQPDHAILLAGYVGVLDYGGILKFGAAQEILTEEFLSKIYNIPVKIVQVNEVNRKVCIPGLSASS